MRRNSPVSLMLVYALIAIICSPVGWRESVARADPPPGSCSNQCDPPCATIIFVDGELTTGGNDGTNWSNAFRTLQAAIDSASSGDEIWVAQGTYTPAAPTEGDARAGTFRLKDGVALFGGFMNGDDAFGDRLPFFNPTILSGDAEGDDYWENYSDNFYHVVTVGDDVVSCSALDGFIVTGGHADGSGDDGAGGGLFIDTSSFEARDCTLRGNYGADGAAVDARRQASFVRCRFEDNTAELNGGAARVASEGASLVDSTFSRNSAMRGGAMYTSGPISISGGGFDGNNAGFGGAVFLNAGSSLIDRVVIESNHADFEGGGIHAGSASTVSLVRSEFDGNTGDGDGGACFIAGQCALNNCVLKKNDALGDAGRGGAVFVSGGDVSVANSTFAYNAAYSASGTGGGFVDPAGSLSIVNSIFWGNRDTPDPDGNWSESLGAQVTGAALWTYSCVQGGGTGCAGCIDEDPLFKNSSTNIRIAQNSPCANAGSNAAIPVGVIEDLDGGPRILRNVVDLGAYETRRILHVDDDAIGGSDGTSWENALTDLQAALAMAEPSDEIWIAGGTYRPGPAGQREATFALIGGVAVYGGFCAGESYRSQRDPKHCESVLSGDLGDNDEEGFTNRAENSYHVVTATGNESARLDGVTIYGGEANGAAAPDDSGGGAVVIGPQVIAGCKFLSNRAQSDGGAMVAGTSSYMQTAPEIDSCVFEDNHSSRGGAVLLNGTDSRMSLERCRFRRNAAGASGGAIHATPDSEITFESCVFEGNAAGDRGGALYQAQDSITELVNCIFSGNSVTNGLAAGGAVYADGQVFMLQSTMVANTANATGSQAGGLYVSAPYGELGDIRSSIVYYNEAHTGTVCDDQIILADAPSISVAYSCIQKQSGCNQFHVTGMNLSSAPVLVRIPHSGADGSWGTVDDEYGDLQLVEGSPCIDEGDPVAVVPQTDVNGDIRIVNCSPDMGAYEHLGSTCSRYINVPNEGSSGNLFETMRLNLQLDQAFGPGDFPPLHVSVAASSSPLAPKETRHSERFHTRPERPTHRGVVDLITGRPLLQEVDFELPFGGAVFRHTRTYSESVTDHGKGSVRPEGAFWDWNGVGWMMGEAPIFLFDSQLPFLNYEAGDKRRCYLIPDAHYAIPFELDVSQSPPVYTAPPWFDAILSHDGDMDSSGTWLRLPTEVYVWLHGGAIKYTFELQFDALRPATASGPYSVVHEPFCTPPLHSCNNGAMESDFCGNDPDGALRGEDYNCVVGPSYPQIFQQGVPHYGIVQRIEDRLGNALEYEYCVRRMDSCYDEQQFCGPVAVTCENCDERGQIKAVRLRAAPLEGQQRGPVVWTLAYVHRRLLWNVEPESVDYENYNLNFQNAVHALYAYEGDVEIPNPCLSIPARYIAAADSVDAIETIDATDPSTSGITPPLPKNWVIQGRYVYYDGDTLNLVGANTDLVELDSRVGMLVKSTVVSRSEQTGGGGDESETWRMYRYKKGPGCHSQQFSCGSGGTYIGSNRLTLKSVYDSETLDLVVKSERLAGSNEAFVVNDVMTLTDDDIVRIIKPDRMDCVACLTDPDDCLGCTTCGDCEQNGFEDKKVSALADLWFDQRTANQYCYQFNSFWDVNQAAPNSSLTCNGQLADVLRTFIGLGAEKEFEIRQSGTQTLHDRRADQSDGGQYAMYQAFHYPKATPPGAFGYGMDSRNHDKDPALYHYPFRYWRRSGFAQSDGGQWITTPATEAFWITVIDEMCDPASYDPIFLEGLKTRRAVEMNSAGFVLRDRTWKFDCGGVGVLVAQEGFGETYKYDCWGRGKVVEVRSAGWGAIQEGGECPSADPNEDGLITVFEYKGQSACECGIEETCGLGELIAVGVKRGVDGATAYTNCYERHPDRRDLVTSETVFPEPAASCDVSGGNTTRYVYEFWPPDVPIYERYRKAIVRKTIVAEQAPMTEGGPSLYAVQDSRFDLRGNLIVQGSGSMLGEWSTSPNYTEFFFSTTSFDNKGQVIGQVVDSPSVNGFTRISPDPATASALDLRTTHQYHPIFGLVASSLPNGRSMRIHHKFDFRRNSLEVWTYPNVQVVGGAFRARSPVQVSRIESGKLVWTKEVALISGTQPPHDMDDVSVIRAATPFYNAEGRLTGVASGAEAVEDPADAEVYVRRSYDAFGQVTRQQDADGTITRSVYDDRGRLIRTLRGTTDIHDVWGTSAPGMPSDDNLVLMEKRYYGGCWTDAGELTAVRRYRDKPVNQYFEEEDPNGQPYPPNNEDDVGWTELHQYDWRMRAVWIQRNDENDAPMSHSATWYDHMDRPRYLVEYGPHAPAAGSAADPRSLGGDNVIPEAADILVASPAPLALIEYVYDRRGNTAETRQYDVFSGAAAAYTATKRYYNDRGQPVEIVAPGGGRQQFVYDAKGRQLVSRTLAGNVEITRVTTQYDLDDRALKSIRWERRHDAPASAPPEPDYMDESEAILSYTYSWYDNAGRLIANANYGTNHSGDDFVNGSAPSYHPTGPAVRDAAGVVVGCNQLLSGDPNCTCYSYDSAGRQSTVFFPDGSRTGYKYDALGRLTLTVENSTASFIHEIRATARRYDAQGRLWMIANLPTDYGCFHIDCDVNWDDPLLEITEMVHGATVVDSSLNPVSENNAYISEVRFPDPETGQPSDTDALSFTYFSDGSLASRTDSRGITMTHAYDTLGRKTRTLIDDSGWFDSFAAGFDPPENRILKLDYAFKPTGEPVFVRAFSRTSTGAERNVSQNVFEYTGLRELTRERQAHGTTVDSSTPDVRYTWDTPGAGGGNFSRLERIDYPAKAGGTVRTSVFNTYGEAAGDVDDVLNRVTQIDLSVHGTTAARYAYTGSSRRVWRELGGGGVVQSAAQMSGGGYDGLDRFGRLTDLHFERESDGATIHRYRHGYDEMGNRLFARVEQWPQAYQDHDNDRSSLFTYDGLQRLKSSSMGRLNETNTAIATGGDAPVPLTSTWNLDTLGNWSDRFGDEGLLLSGDFDGDGAAEEYSVEHIVDRANQITEVVQSIDGSPPSVIDVVNDVAGNLVYDGTYVYQYDAWNRLIQINQRGSVTVAAFDEFGRIASGTLGKLVGRFVFDGLGRLIRTETPHSATDPAIRTEDYYYDGVRRIQEVVRQRKGGGGPVVQDVLAKKSTESDDGWIVGDDPEVSIDVPPAPDGDANASGPSGGSTGDVFSTFTDREYVYGPEHVDEFLAQIDRGGRILYFLQDANHNVAGLVNVDGTVYSQYTYSPYGQLLTADPDAYGFASHARSRVGHQGLFFFRLDAPFSAPSLSPGAVGLYHNRNRTYAPNIGRFLQRDPNDTALPLLASATHSGRPMTVGADMFDAEGLYGDGMSLFAYVGSNPINSTDPLGLSFDWDAAIDEEIDNHNAWRVYVLGAINEGAGIAAIGLGAALEIASTILGVDLLESVYVVATGQGGFWESVDIVLAVTPIGKLGKIVNTLGKVGTLARKTGRGGKAIAEGFTKWLKKGPKDVKVYVGYKNGVPSYVGVSNNVARRGIEHKEKYDELRAISGNLTRNEARAIEQLIKMKNAKRFKNINNPIDPQREFFSDALSWAQEFVRSNGIRINY